MEAACGSRDRSRSAFRIATQMLSANRLCESLTAMHRLTKPHSASTAIARQKRPSLRASQTGKNFSHFIAATKAIDSGNSPAICGPYGDRARYLAPFSLIQTHSDSVASVRSRIGQPG